MAEPLTIDVWSDVACPWCYIGKRNMEAGIAAFREAGGPPVAVTFHSFQLAPDTPVEFAGGTVEYLVERKGLAEADVRRMLDRVTGIAEDAGITLDLDAVRHTNTGKAHQLIHYAGARGRQLEATERLLRAYFAEGRHVGDVDELADLAADIGLDRADAARSLRSDEYLPAVRADQAQAAEYGIRGVPFFVVDGRYAVSGAQAPETFTQVLASVADERAGTPA